MKIAHLIAAAAFTPVLASAADFSGTWKFTNEFRGQPSTITCTLVQAKNELSGSCKPDTGNAGASELKGTVEGAKAKWGYDLVFNDKPARVDYEVTLATDGTLSGNLLRNGAGSPITGERRK